MGIAPCLSQGDKLKWLLSTELLKQITHLSYIMTAEVQETPTEIMENSIPVETGKLPDECTKLDDVTVCSEESTKIEDTVIEQNGHVETSTQPSETMDIDTESTNEQSTTAVEEFTPVDHTMATEEPSIELPTESEPATVAPVTEAA